MNKLCFTATLLCLVSGTALASGHGGAKPKADPPSAFAQKFIHAWDLNGDGMVTRAEAREQRGNLFHMFDDDENGVLDSKEYDLFDETRAADIENAGMWPGAGRRGSPAALLARDYTDADKDGEVTEAEFLDANDTWFDRLDRTGDGVLTLADFGHG